MNDTIAILSDSLIDLDKTSTDYMIIEEQLKNKNPCVLNYQNLNKKN